MKTKPIFITTLISAVVNVALGFALIPSLGGVGAAAASLVGYICIWLIRLIDSRKMIVLDYHYVRDGITFLLLFAQVAVEMLNLSFGWILSGALCLAVLLVQREAVVMVWKILVGMLKKIPLVKK